MDTISKYNTNQRIKSYKSKKYWLLDPLKLSNRPYELISLDFIIKLLKTRNRIKYLWVVVDRFINIAYFILLPNTKASKLTKKFLKEIYRLYGIPEDMVLDRVSKFTGY